MPVRVTRGLAHLLFVLLLSVAGAQSNPSEVEAAGEPHVENSATTLMLAASSGTVQDLLRLINAGANLEARDEHGWTALMYAASFGPTDNVQLLLNIGVDVEAKDETGQTPLMHAAKDGASTSVLALIQAGANKAAKDKHGWTALMYAGLEQSDDATKKVELLRNFKPPTITNTRPTHPRNGCTSTTTASSSSMTCWYEGLLSYRSTCTSNPVTYEVSCHSESY